MSNVLDLKNRSVGAVGTGFTADVEPPADVQSPAELTSSDDVPSAPEAEAVVAVEQEAPIDIEDIAEAALAASVLPTAVSWEAHHPLMGHAKWKHYMLLSGLGILGALISLWQRSVMPFVVLFVGVIALELRERWSRPVSVAIDEHGVSVDGHEYPHTDFASFHVHRMPDETLELSLKAQRKYLPHLRLPLGEQDPYEVHAVLAQHIPEGRHTIPLVEYLLRKPR